jgi:N-acyl-D-aspartate/D-glutamate deacylase
LRSLANWGTFTLLETFTARWKPYEGRPIGAIATELGKSAWDTLVDIVIDDDLNTVIASMDSGQNDASWEKRVEVWRDPRAIVGASDAGAHLDMIDSFSYATTLIAKTTVERSLLPLEEAVHYLTGSPAALYGLKGRGVLATGNAADVVVFDPTRIGPAEVFTKFDLPGGSGRVYGEANGIAHVLVNGVPCVDHGELLDARPGALLRSGKDTDTVTAR